MVLTISLPTAHRKLDQLVPLWCIDGATLLVTTQVFRLNGC